MNQTGCRLVDTSRGVHQNVFQSLQDVAAVVFLALASAPAASSDDDRDAHPVIDGEFEIQPYLLPNGQGYRHLTSMINEANNELVLFGGLGDGPPSPPTPMNHKVYTLDLEQAPSEQEWEERSTDDVVPAPWFTTTRGFSSSTTAPIWPATIPKLTGCIPSTRLRTRSSSYRNRRWTLSSRRVTVAQLG